jgi:4-hydroxybenzoate polyprenyltransferase
VSPLARVGAYGKMIRFSHSIFALPFALASAALAASGSTSPRQLVLILVAMVAARSAAMGFNRLVDQDIDARNPRTAGRELPRGRLSRREVWGFVLLSAGAFVVAAGLLNRLCLWLSPVALLIVFGYSYTKRFTAWSHLVLGLSLSIAPVGAWLALRGSPGKEPLVLALAVLCWVAGFDIIYACQDADFDRSAGLHSLPARLGIPQSLVVARVLHVCAASLLLSLFWLTPLHPVYLVGLLVIVGLLAWQHTLVRADDTTRAQQAFNLNGWVGLGYLVTVLAARFLRGVSA